jgi:hypothetical protein
MWNEKTGYKAENLIAFTQLDSYQLHIIPLHETKCMGNNVWDTKTYNILQIEKQNGK